MEDTHRVETASSSKGLRLNGLNPCSNGRYSQRRQQRDEPPEAIGVLILVLMEDTHRAINGSWSVTLMLVLILVLMEDTHRGKDYGN